MRSFWADTYCNTRAHLPFTSFLHLYNMLQHIGVMEKTEVLEALCDLYLEQVFVGVRPKQAFKSALLAFHGGTIKPDGNGSWNLAAKRGTRGVEAMYQKAFSRMQPRTWSLFSNLSCLSNGYDMLSAQKLGKGMKLKSKHDSSDDTKHK
jgi:hypothetical protein